MGRTRKKNRISSKIDELPSEIKGQVDVMLSDTSNSYQDVSGWLKEKGYEISKSSVGRYAVRSNTAAQRLLEAQSRTEALVNVVRKNPDADYTEAGLMLMMGYIEFTNLKVTAYNAYAKDAVIRLTKAGVDLAEGTIEDAGVDV